MLWLKKLKKLFQIGKKPSYLMNIMLETFAKSQRPCEFAGYKRKNEKEDKNNGIQSGQDFL